MLLYFFAKKVLPSQLYVQEKKYSGPLVARTLMARLPQLFRTRS